jgi:acyl-CoA dehydrogenase family protein 9
MSQAALVPEQQGGDDSPASSFAKSLFLGEIHQDMVFPYPRMPPEEGLRVDELVSRFHEVTVDYDPRVAEENGWVGDSLIAALGDAGLLGLYVEEEYGGQGLSQTGYCKVFEAVAAVDPTLSVVMGVHQSIGYKGIALFGSDEQKQRFLPDLAAGRTLAGYALTEPSAGSDAYHLQSRAVRQSDGAWLLNGEKRYIGNGSKAGLFTTFARAEVDGKDSHIALIVTADMDGFEVGERYDTMGLRANDLRRLRFNDVRVPAENVLGEPGEGFAIAMQILNNGRMSLGGGSVGGARRMLDLAIKHTSDREQFGRPLADFELVREKIGWMGSYLYGLESMSYLTTGLVDRGVADYSLESAICKVAGTEFIWYQANRAMQLAGGEGYMRDAPYEKTLRDIRIFPIFEGANDVMRAYIALNGFEPVSEDLAELGDVSLREPIRSIGVFLGYAARRIERKVVPERINRQHAALDSHAKAVSEQVRRLSSVTSELLIKHREAVKERQLDQKRLADSVADIYAQIAVISRMTATLDREDRAVLPEQRFFAETFCGRAARRVGRRLDQIESNDDARLLTVADGLYERAARS